MKHELFPIYQQIGILINEIKCKFDHKSASSQQQLFIQIVALRRRSFKDNEGYRECTFI